jgi:hypothetical protein
MRKLILVNFYLDLQRSGQPANTSAAMEQF